MRGILLVFLFLLGSNAFAKAGFHIPEELQDRPDNYERAIKAVVDVDECAGVILSKEGYVATNIHCLKSCLTPQEYMGYFPDIKMEKIEGESFSALKIHEQVPLGLTCPRWAMSALNIFEYNLADPKVVWMGKGKHNHDELKVADLSEADFLSFADLTEDIAILKYDVSRATSEFPCLPMAESSPSDRLWAIGFPDYTKRGSNGQKRVSLGEVRKSVSEDLVLQKYLAEIDPALHNIFWQREERIWNRPHILISSTDAHSGNSGGALINANGELEAISFSVTKLSSDEYLGASVMGVRPSFIKRELEKSLGSKMSEAVFNCPRSSEAVH